MADIYHTFGDDILYSSSGDIMLASDSDETNQRILRRIATNKGDYIFQPNYGAGIGAMVGSPDSADEIRGLIYGQIRMEDKVAQSPAPEVGVTNITGGVFVSLSYYDVVTGQPFNLSFSIN